MKRLNRIQKKATDVMGKAYKSYDLNFLSVCLFDLREMRAESVKKMKTKKTKSLGDAWVLGLAEGFVNGRIETLRGVYSKNNSNDEVDYCG